MNATSSETATHRPIAKRGAAANPTPAIDWLEVLDVIRELDLVPASELDRLASVSGDDPSTLARALVQAKRLTPYQAGAVLQGKARGLLIGQYLVEDKLGVGGMGVVFKAKHRPSKRVVALKILPPSFGREPESVRRFRREFQIASRLSHPNLVASIEASEDRGVHYLTMEYIPGCDLDRLVSQGGPMALKLALQCTIQAARGLEAAHAQGVIHRDIKPGNIMIDPTGTVRVLDLGLARVIEATSGFGQSAVGTLTQTGTYMGTVDFLAPEQAEDAKSADARADIYSLGCTLYFLLTAKPPFPGDSILKRLLAHQHRPAPTLRASRPEVPEALDAIYMQMMAKRPEERPRTISEVVLALEACRTSAREAGDASADLKNFARTVIKRAPVRGVRGPDASIFAKPSDRNGGFSFDPDLNLEDLVGDYRDEEGHAEIPEDRLPPIVSRPPQKRVRRQRSSVPYGLIGMTLIGLVAVGYAFKSRTRSDPLAKDSAVLGALPVAVPEPNPPAIPDKVVSPEFQQLFNGKNLVGWAGAVDDYEVRDGFLSCKPDRKAVIYDPVNRTDFVARVEFRLAPGAESGLFLRYPGQGDGAYDGMCEIQIIDDSHPAYANLDARTLHGSAYAMAAATRGHLKALGEWNVQVVTVRGSTVRVELNGTVILDTDLAAILDIGTEPPHPGKNRVAGYFGVQSGPGQSQGNVQYRTIEIRELLPTSTPTPSPIVATAKPPAEVVAPKPAPEPTDAMILAALDRTIDLDFKNAELAELLKFIKGATESPELPNGIRIYVDPIGLARAEKTMFSPVTVSRKATPLKIGLRSALRPLGLTFFVREGVLYISSR